MTGSTVILSVDNPERDVTGQILKIQCTDSELIYIGVITLNASSINNTTVKTEAIHAVNDTSAVERGLFLFQSQNVIENQNVNQCFLT